MKTYRKAYYKADYFDGKYLDDAISIFTTVANVTGLLVCLKFKDAGQALKRRYSHCEIWWPDEDGRFSHNQLLPLNQFDPVNPPVSVPDEFVVPDTYLGQCFTSTLRGDNNGTVIRDASTVFKNPRRWDIQVISVPDDEFDNAKEWAINQAENNEGYNKKTIGRFFNPFRSDVKDSDDKQNICSVACSGFDWVTGLFGKWWVWSPLRLWWKTDRLGIETKPLLEM